ncbi:MAG: LysR family transcriptional regulator [Myxococcales bacterium FL481]|nr:MAG: LysR family transcriptional regulator [Myxococcales bacterium FL481]
MDLNELLVFVRVVDAGSFIGAARQLNLPKSTVSRRVSTLEARLSARLLQRTTRNLSLTDAGQVYYEHAARVVAEMEAAELAVSQLERAPRGRLRITAPLNLAFLSSLVASFMRRYPQVDVELVAADRVVDLIGEGFDVAIRAGKLADSSAYARPLGAIESHLVASPGFVRRCGPIDAPAHLADVACLLFGSGPGVSQLELSRGRQTSRVDVRSRLVANEFDYLVSAARAGLGVAVLPSFLCHADVRATRLVRVLPHWCAGRAPLHAIYPSARHLSPKVTALLDHLREHATATVGGEPG